MSCIFLTWACKPFNGLLANVKPLSLTIQAIPTKTKSRKRGGKKREGKKKKKKTKTLNYTKLEYCKEILDFTNIEYHIIFINYTNYRLVVLR